MTSWPFPFFGQGDASYFEWFEMFVWFVDPVPAPQRKAALADAPRLCKLDATWPHPQLLWPSTGDQWIQRHLVEEYGSAAARRRLASAIKRGDGDDDGDGDDLLACGNETERFNTAIERWLLALHERRPILFAARREDGEAGGTKLGPWHAWSVAAYPERVQAQLAAVTKQKLGKNDLRRAAIEIVLDHVGAKKVEPPKRAVPSKGYLAASAAVNRHDVKAATKAISKLTGALEHVQVLGELKERLSSWGLVFDAAWTRVALALARGAFSDGTFDDHAQLCFRTGDYTTQNHCAELYYVALAAAHVARERSLFARLSANLREGPPIGEGREGQPDRRRVDPRFVYGRLGAVGTPIDRLAMALEKVDANGLEHAMLVRAELGDHAGALKLAERAAKLGPRSWTLVGNAIAIELRANKRFSAATLRRWMKRAPKRGASAGYWENVACAQVRLGQLEAAMASLGKAVALGFDRATIAADEHLAPLRTRADFIALVAPRRKTRVKN